MKWLHNLIRKIARTEIETMLNDKRYIEQLKTSIRNDTEQLRVNENEEYLRSCRDHG